MCKAYHTNRITLCNNLKSRLYDDRYNIHIIVHFPMYTSIVHCFHKSVKQHLVFSAQEKRVVRKVTVKTYASNVITFSGVLYESLWSHS